MDEKLIFNNPPSTSPPSDAPPTDQGQPPAAPPPDDANSAPPPADPPQEPPQEELTTMPPQKNPIIEILKKVGIGVGIVLVLIFLVILFIPKEKGAKNVTLLWWGLWEDARTVESIILDFEKSHPTIKIRYIKQNPEGYKKKLLTRISQGSAEAPDIFRYHNTWLPMVKDSLATLPTDVITLEEFQKSYYPVMQKDLVRNGGLYGIPLGADSLSLFINPDLFKNSDGSPIMKSDGTEVGPPKTWNDLCEAAELLTKKNETEQIQIAGAALGEYANVTHAADIIGLLFAQQGKGIMVENFATASDKEKITVLDFYTSFYKAGKSCPSKKVWDETLEPSIIAFSKGKLAMYLGYSWDIFTMQSINKDLKFKVYPAPLIGKKSKTVASYWVEGVSNKSQNQKEAFEFMKFLTQKETLQKLYAEESKVRPFGEPYPRVDLADSLKNTEIYPFVSQLPTATSSYFASDTHDGDGLNSKLNTYLQNAINSIIKDSGSTDTAVEQLNPGVSQVVTEYGLVSQ